MTVSTTYEEQETRGGVLTSYKDAPTRTITAGGTTYAYRELGPKGGMPVVFFVHLAATLDNWDPRIIDSIAKNRHVIAFDNKGVGASTGQVPDSVEAMADDAYAFIKALGLDKIDILSFPSVASSPRPSSSSTPSSSASSSSPVPDPRAARTSTRSPASPTGTCCERP